MTEPAVRPLGLIKLLNLYKFGSGDLFEHHLRQALTSLDDIIFFSEVYHYEVDEPPVVAVYGPGRINEGYTVLYSQPAPGPDLSFVSLRHLYVYAAGYELDLTRSKDFVLFNVSVKVHTA